MQNKLLKQKSNRLLLVIIIGLAISFLITPTNAAKADIYDDFLSANIDSALWSINDPSNIFYQSGGLLQADGPPNFVSPTLNSTRKFVGDFDFILVYANFLSTATDFTNGVPKIQLAVQSFSNQDGIFIERQYGQGGHSFGSNGFINGSWLQGVGAPATLSSGRLRINRTGSTITTYYDDGSGWQTLGTFTNVFTGIVRLDVAVYTGDDGNFHVESDYVDATATGSPQAAYRISWMYVQQRKYENENSFNRLSFGVRDDFDRPITDNSEVVNIELYDPNNNLITLNDLRFWSEDTINGSYDGNKSQLFYGDFVFDSGFSADISANLIPGTYRLEVTLSDATVLQRNYDFNQLVNLPFISSNSFGFFLDQSGNVFWEWDFPIELIYLSFNYETSARAIIEIYDNQQYVGSVWLRLPSHMRGMIIPYDLIQKMKSKGDNYKSMIQLRTNDNNNRTYSSKANFETPPSASASVTSLLPVENACGGNTATLWAQVENTGTSPLPSGAKVWFYVDAPIWSKPRWVGSAEVSGLPAGSKAWYAYDWSIPSDLKQGTSTYRAQAWVGSSAISALSVTQSFWVGSPGKAILVSPSGTITDTTPTYSWEAVENATWYYLWVNDSTGNKIKKWYTAEDANCSDGTGVCSVTPTTVLADGACNWWIQTWNDCGKGLWSSKGTFSVQ